MKGLRAIEEKEYNHCKEWCSTMIENKEIKSKETFKNIIDMLRSFSDDDAAKYAASNNMTVAEAKAKNMGTIRALEEALTIHSAYFDTCDNEYFKKQEQERIAKYKAEQVEKGANRDKNPIFYIGNGGGCDCFDYLGWDTNNKKLVKVFVDWDSGHGNEMLPDWEDNSINRLPDSYIDDFKKFSADYFSHRVGSPSMFFSEINCKVSIPCKVTTGRKFRGVGTLVGYRTKKYRDWNGYEHISKTALIIGMDGNQQEAVSTRVEISTETLADIVKRGIMNMTVSEIASVYGTFLWHFGRYKDMANNDIIKSAFKDLNTED